MTKKETIKLFAIFTAAYPRFDTFKDPEKLRPVIEIWTEMLEDLPYPAVEVAAKKLILESPFPPTIADIRKQIVDITQVDKTDAATAWGEVVKAIRNYGYYREPEALASLSPRVANVVRMMSFRELCLCEEPGVVRGQFLKMFEQVSAREKQNALLPENLREQIKQIGSCSRQLELAGGPKN